jgi:hypothetical protein
MRKDKRSATSFRDVSVASWSGVQVRVGLIHKSCSTRLTPELRFPTLNICVPPTPGTNTKAVRRLRGEYPSYSLI